MLVIGVTSTNSSAFSCLLPQFSTASGLNLGSCGLKQLNGRTFGERFSFRPRREFGLLTYCGVKSKWGKQSEVLPVAWEEPDDGSGSDYDEEDEELEDNDFDFESDWEGESDTSSNTRAADNYASNYPVEVLEQETHVSSATRNVYNSAFINSQEDSEDEAFDVSTATTGMVRNSISKNYGENLAKEVEQLLGPEEKAILQENATYNLDKLSSEKWRPLQTLALSGQIQFMDTLLRDGLDIDSVDKDGLTALHKAIIGKKEAVISHLMRKGANINVKDRDGASPLHYAVQVGATQTVKLLIKYEVDVNVADNEGWTPLHVAVQTRKRDIIKILLVNGADKNRRNKDGMTPLDLCLCYGKDFKSYELAKLVKIVPANRDL